MNLALFDFDGTITDNDSFTAFLYFAATRQRLFWGKVLLLPQILSYKAGLLPAAKARACVAGFAFKDRPLSGLESAGKKYARDIIPRHIKSKAFERIQWHKEQGDEIVVVSASLDLYLSPWCDTHGLALICSSFETKDGIITGRYDGPDCSGTEKARQIKARYDLTQFKTIYAYGDTSEDREMLDLADIKYYRWKQI